MPDIYLLIDGQQAGPYTEEQVRQSIAEGHIPADQLAWHEGLTEWKPLPTLTAMPYQPQPPPFVPSIPTQPTSVPSRRDILLKTGLALVFICLGLFLSLSIVMGLYYHGGAMLKDHLSIILFLLGCCVIAAISKVVAKCVNSKGKSSAHFYAGIGGFIAIAFVILVLGVGIIIGYAVSNNSSTAMGSDQNGASGDNAHQLSTDGSDSEDWSANSPESMLRYVTAQVKKDGVGLGTVTDASYKIGDSDGSSEVFVGEITFTVHADAASTGLPSGFSGSTTQKFHAFFSYEVEKHRWSSIRITDSNNSPLDSDSVLSTIANYFPEPYQIALHSH
jgi:hypothetical protein